MFCFGMHNTAGYLPQSSVRYPNVDQDSPLSWVYEGQRLPQAREKSRLHDLLQLPDEGVSGRRLISLCPGLRQR